MEKKQDSEVRMVAARGEKAEGQLVRRRVAAQILGVSESKVRRLEDTVLTPIVDEKGVHLHSVERLSEYRVQTVSSTSAPANEDGEVAALAFGHFDRGCGPADVVQLLQLEPAVVRKLHREWAHMRGCIVFGGELVQRFEMLMMNLSADEAGTPEDFLRILEELDTRKCRACNRQPPRLCLHCYAHRPPAAQQVLLDAKAARRAQSAADVRKAVSARAATRARERAAREVSVPNRQTARASDEAEGDDGTPPVAER